MANLKNKENAINDTPQDEINELLGVKELKISPTNL